MTGDLGWKNIRSTIITRCNKLAWISQSAIMYQASSRQTSSAVFKVSFVLDVHAFVIHNDLDLGAQSLPAFFEECFELIVHALDACVVLSLFPSPVCKISVRFRAEWTRLRDGCDVG